MLYVSLKSEVYSYKPPFKSTNKQIRLQVKVIIHGSIFIFKRMGKAPN